METFNIGDYVRQTFGGSLKGEVVDVLIRVRRADGTTTSLRANELELAPKPLSEAEAWLECALLIGKEVSSAGLPLYEGESREIRHQCYRLLGGNGIKIEEQTKVRVRDLIERAVRQQEEN